MPKCDLNLYFVLLALNKLLIRYLYTFSCSYENFLIRIIDNLII